MPRFYPAYTSHSHTLGPPYINLKQPPCNPYTNFMHALYKHYTSPMQTQYKPCAALYNPYTVPYKPYHKPYTNPLQALIQALRPPYTSPIQTLYTHTNLSPLLYQLVHTLQQPMCHFICSLHQPYAKAIPRPCQPFTHHKASLYKP